MAAKTISREASDKTKGFRLQKMRAIRLMLETLERHERPIFYTAIENIEDVSHTDISGAENGTYYEEDKAYSESHGFTIFSPEVTNTLVSFFDIYIGSWRASDDVLLGFYTTARIGKERKKVEIDGVETEPPLKPILESLSSNVVPSDHLVKIVRDILYKEYCAQYESKASSGYTEALRDITVEEFRKFLSKITWQFGGEDETTLKQTILRLIKDSKLHNVRLAGKEETIFAILMELLDERQGEASLVRRVVSASDVELVFLKAQSEEAGPSMDPAWKELKRLEEEITDKRNLPEKITAVCGDYSAKKLKHLARLACRSKTEQVSSDRTILSLKYRVYEACSEVFIRQRHQANTEDEVDNIIDALNVAARHQIKDLKNDYSYTVSGDQVISGLIMDLFDGCFIAFDEIANDD